MAASYSYPDEYEHDGVTYDGWVLKDTITKIASELSLDAQDVVIATYPKSGTTWMEQILYSVDVGPEKAKERTECLSDLMRFVEVMNEGDVTEYELFTAASPPRWMKSHLYVNYFERFLQNKTEQCPKFIIVARNPKDVLVSYYHFHRMIPMLEFGERTWDEFFQIFKEKRLDYGDSNDFNIGWWKYRDHPNVLFIRYEDMLNDTASAVHQVADLVGRTLTDDEVKMVVDQSSFKQMREKGAASYHKGTEMLQEDISPFFRTGKKGDWRNYFSEEQSDYVDAYVKAHCEPVGLTYTY